MTHSIENQPVPGPANSDKGMEKKDTTTQPILERIWEGGLWSTRYIVLLGVFFSTIAAIAVFILGSYEIIHAIMDHNPWTDTSAEMHSDLLVGIIGAVDLYLIGVVLLIFGFGIYELFISQIDVAQKDDEVNILEISSLDELKNKIIKVIIMVLIVTFFERVLNMDYETPLDMLYFAISIFALAFGVYLINKHGAKENSH